MIPAAVAQKDPRAEAAMRRWEELRQTRMLHEQDWEDIAWLIRGQGGGFSVTDRGATRREKPLSSEPILASSGMASGIYSNLTNPANNWGGLEIGGDPDLRRWGPAAEWEEIATNRVRNSFRPEVSSFYSSTWQAYADLACFGNAAGYDELATDGGPRRFIDVTVSLTEVVYEIDAHGFVAEVVRRFRLSPGQAVAMFADMGALPPKIAELAEKGSTDKITFYHHVLRNTQAQPGRIGARGKRWLSRYACEIDATLVREGGYDDMPFYAPRWMVDSGMSWGYGPGTIALPAARVLHQLELASLQAKQRNANPTLLAPNREDWPLSGQAVPGEVLYGGVNQRGDPVVHPLANVGNTQITDAERRAKVEEISKAFHYSIIPLMNRTGITPEETRIIEEASLRQWAPHADRVMEEWAARKFERRFKLLWRAGQIPPPPEGLPEGTPMNVRYQSAATQALQAREGIAVRTFIQDLAPLAALSQSHMARVAGRLDPDAALEALHAASPSLPARLLRPREAADAAEQQAQAQAQAAGAMQMAREGAGAAKDAAAAGIDLSGLMGGGA